MKKILLFVLAISLLSSSVVFAQTKTAIVNIEKIVQESKAGKKVQDDIQKINNENLAILEPLKNEILKLQKDFESQQKLLTEAAKKTKIEEYQKKAIEYEKKAQELQEKISQKSDVLLDTILADVEKYIKIVADEGKYDLILLEQTVIYNGPSIKNITNDVIKKYDEATK